jgi:Transglycosylase SLT domain/SPOR domain
MSGGDTKSQQGCGIAKGVRIFGFIIRIEPVGPDEKPRMALLALATVLAHLASALPVQAQVLEAESNGTHDSQSVYSVPGLDNKGVQTDAVQTLLKPTDLRSLCQTIASAAAQNDLPFEFFSRIIWQESRFNSGVIGPATRGGQRAQGIAQFMPATAVERSVSDPFDPFEALPKSAEFLRELRAEFGNLGLAAAAYNAGPQRVRDWLDGKRTLPSETQAYVQKVTGHSAQEWKLPKLTVLAIAVPAEMSCVESVGLLHKPQPPAVSSPTRPAWVAQLIGDNSEAVALSRFRQMQGKLRSALGGYEPAILRTTIKTSAAPIWVRVRIEFDNRQAADALCSKLEAAHEPCLVQRNFDNGISRKSAISQSK